MIPPPFGIVATFRPAIEADPILVGTTIFSVILRSFAAVARALVPHPSRPVRHVPTAREVAS